MTQLIEADAYGSRIALGSTEVRIEAKGRVGHGALGTDERIIAIDDIRALAFEPAGRIKNGKLEIVNGHGKTVVHVRHKQNDEVRSLYEALRSELPEEVVARTTDGAPLFSEDKDAMTAQMNTWAESKKRS